MPSSNLPNRIACRNSSSDRRAGRCDRVRRHTACRLIPVFMWHRAVPIPMAPTPRWNLLAIQPTQRSPIPARVACVDVAPLDHLQFHYPTSPKGWT